jgi:hypothetical protein
MPRLLARMFGFALDTPKANSGVPDRPRNDKMDAFLAHIHQNEQLSADNVYRALTDSKEKKTVRG